MIFVATKKGTKKIFTPLSLLFLDPGDPRWIKTGSGIWDKHPGSATQEKEYFNLRNLLDKTLYHNTWVVVV